MTKPTSAMSREELARVVAAQYGWTGKAGGWVYAGDLALAHGWHSLGKALEREGVVKVGVGVNWHAVDRLLGAEQGLARRLVRARKAATRSAAEDRRARLNFRAPSAWR